MSEAFGRDTDADLFNVPGEYVKVEKAIKMIERKTFAPIHSVAGDSIEFTYKAAARLADAPPQGFFSRLFDMPIPERVVFKKELPIQRKMSVDTAVIIEIKDEFGLDVGCGILIGESKK